MRRTVRSNRSSAPASVSMSSGFSFLGGFTMNQISEHERLSMHIGRSITSWQSVESGLFLLYAKLIASPNLAAVSASYHSIMNFNIRLDLVDAAAQIMLEKSPYLDSWNKLRERCETASRLRNKLAHFTVVTDTRKNVRHKVYLTPTFYDSTTNRKYRKKARPRLNWKEVLKYEGRFERLSLELERFSNKC